MENGKNNMTLKEHLNNAKAVSLKDPEANFGEVEMFESMLEWFKGNSKCSVAELHKKQVANGVDSKAKDMTCEISDLMTICYSPKCNCAKIQFLQAKYCEDAKKNNRFTFNANSRQYRLLKDCPYITPKRTHLPSDILVHSCSPAITSYGVFYQDDNGELNMAYEITKMLVPEHPEQMTFDLKGRSCSFETLEDVYGRLWWNTDCWWPHCSILCRAECDRECFGHDLISTLELNSYTENLLNFRVGSIICGDKLSALANGLAKLYAKNKNRFSGKDFAGFIDRYKNNELSDDEDRESYFAVNEPNAILLINIDKETREN